MPDSYMLERWRIILFFQSRDHGTQTGLKRLEHEARVRRLLHDSYWRALGVLLDSCWELRMPRPKLVNMLLPLLPILLGYKASIRLCSITGYRGRGPRWLICLIFGKRFMQFSYMIG
ncbi:hypothetical protein BJX64DRAFT_255359 [Aspergillus heterothallicus]